MTMWRSMSPYDDDDKTSKMFYTQFYLLLMSVSDNMWVYLINPTIRKLCFQRILRKKKRMYTKWGSLDSSVGIATVY
jgi:hypothetical protein